MAKARSVQVKLTGPVARYVQSRVAEGAFESPADVVAAAIDSQRRREAMDQRKLEELRAAVQVGLRDSRADRVQPASKVMKEFRRKVSQRRGRAA